MTLYTLNNKDLHEGTPPEGARVLVDAAWQPISTAPKDGAPVFIWRDGFEFPVPAIWGDNDAAWGWVLLDDRLCLGVDDGFLGWEEDIEDGLMPTHWLPIPPPPQPAAPAHALTEESE